MDAYAALPDDAGDAGHQPGGLHAGAVGVEVAGHGSGHPDPVGHLPGGELAVEPLPLGLRAGDGEDAAAHDVGLDALPGGHPDDLVDRGAQRVPEALDAVLACHGGVRPRAAGELARQPAAVASRGAEAGELRLDDPDVEGRVGLREVVRRPEAGEPTAHDRDVAGRVTLEPVGGGGQPDLLPPEGHAAVAHAAIVLARPRSGSPLAVLTPLTREP